MADENPGDSGRKPTSNDIRASSTERNSDPMKSQLLQQQTRRLLGKNVRVGVLLTGFVLGVYGYTIYSVSQEHFLEDLENAVNEAKENTPSP